MVVTNKDKYNAKYGFPKDESHSRSAISRKTGIPLSILNAVYRRGLGARLSNKASVRRASDGKKVGGNTLKGKMSGSQWAQARIYSFITKQKGTWGGADKDLADKVKRKNIKGYTR